MKLAKWDPIRELEEASTRLNRFLGSGHLFPRGAEMSYETTPFADWVPPVDIKETVEELFINVELPDMKKEDIHVEVDNGVLAIRGERKLEKEEKGKKYHRIERAYGTFMRAFALPEEVDTKKLTAEYKHGVLELRLPKTLEKKAKAIDIKVT